MRVWLVCGLLQFREGLGPRRLKGISAAEVTCSAFGQRTGFSVFGLI